MSKLGKPIWLLVWVVLIGMLGFQAYAYYYRLPLSLGPRVILQPWMQRAGYVPYEEIVDLHMPLMPILLQGLSGLGLGELRLAKVLVVGLLTLTTLLTFIFAKRAAGMSWGLWAVFYILVWSPFFAFGKLWHESFLAPAYLLYLFLYRPGPSPRSITWSILLGLLGGITVLLKQHAALVFLAFLVWDLVNSLAHRRAIFLVLRELFIAGIVSFLPLLVYAGFQLIQAGTLSGFFYWTVGYNLNGVYKNLSALSPTSAQVSALLSCALLLPLALICMAFLLRKSVESWHRPGLWLVLMAAASVTAYPRFGTFHLQPALPFLVLLSTFALASLIQFSPFSRWVGVGVLTGLSIYWVISLGASYSPVFAPTQPRVIAEYSPLEPLARQLRQEIGVSPRLFIFMDDESLSNLYYLTQSAPPRYWIFHYPWYMLDSVKEKILVELANNPPDWVIYSPQAWNARKYAPEVDDYLLQHYQLQRSFDLNWGKLELLRKKE
jgi:hypothetical protein